MLTKFKHLMVHSNSISAMLHQLLSAFIQFSCRQTDRQTQNAKNNPGFAMLVNILAVVTVRILYV